MTTEPSGPSPTSRPHVASRLEDRFTAVVTSRLRRRGWVARVEPYPGYGTGGWVRLLARVLLAVPGTDAQEATESDDVVRPRAVRGWRSFLTAQVPGAVVEVEVGGRRHEVRADRGGYVDAVVEADLPAGWHDVTWRVDGEAVAGRLLVLGPEPVTGLVSDVDDTVWVTALPRPLLAAWNSLVLHEGARRPVPGMADLYRRLAEARPGMATFYLSTGAWNVAPALRRFLARHGYPLGPLLLTDWGPTNTGWFRSGREHKHQTLRRLLAELPQVRWVLVGDDGQHDPQIYAQVAAEHPDRVELVLVRQLSPAEQVLSHGTPTPSEGRRPDEEPGVDGGPPTVRAEDGHALSLRLIDAGFL